MNITRDNVDRLLDAGALQCAMKSGRWWTIRRNGKTIKWKRNPERIVIPFTAGLRSYGRIDENSFMPDGTLSPHWFRINPEGEWL